MKMGVTSIMVSTEQVGGESRGSGKLLSLNRESRGVGKDFLMSVSDIYNMSVDDTIIIFQHCNPIYAHKVPITAFPEFKNSRKVYDKDLPNFDDKLRRQQVRSEEEIRIAKYNREHPYEEQTEDETYEEPLDFAAMSTTEILLMVIKEDIRDLKKYAAEKKANGFTIPNKKKNSPSPIPTMKPESAKQEPQPVIRSAPVSIFFDDDDTDFFCDEDDSEQRMQETATSTEDIEKPEEKTEAGLEEQSAADTAPVERPQESQPVQSEKAAADPNHKEPDPEPTDEPKTQTGSTGFRQSRKPHIVTEQPEQNDQPAGGKPKSQPYIGSGEAIIPKAKNKR